MHIFITRIIEFIALLHNRFLDNSMLYNNVHRCKEKKPQIHLRVDMFKDSLLH